MDTPLNPPKKKPRSKLGKRKQRKRRSSARTRKVETGTCIVEPLLVREKERENQDEGLLIVEVGCGGSSDFSTTTKTKASLQRQPVPPQSSSSSSSMPETAVTSRSKRLRGATTTTIAYTDRKTRSTSSSHSYHGSNSTTNSNIFVEGQEQEGETLQIASTSFTGCKEQNTSPQSKGGNNYSNGESEEEEDKYQFQTEDTNDSNNVNNHCSSELDTNFKSYIAQVVDNNEGTRGSHILENTKSMKSEITEDEEEIDEASKIQPSIPAQEKFTRDLSSRGQHPGEAKTLKEENLANCQPEKKVKEEFDGDCSVDLSHPNTTIVVQNVAQVDNNNLATRDLSLLRPDTGHKNKTSKGGSGLVPGQHQHGEKYVTIKSLSSVSTSPSSGGGGGGLSVGGKKCKGVEGRKLTTLAPMLLMNNLPYMGELTFDTRPRRGRKPKKADICHLISKNYGIHFPNSYTNTPYTGPPSSSSPPSLFPSVGEKVPSHQQTLALHGKSGAGKLNKNAGKKNKDRIKTGSSSLVSSCPSSSSSSYIVPSSSSTQKPPPLLPISTSNRFKSLGSSSTFSKVSGNKNGKSILEAQNNANNQQRDSGSMFDDGVFPGEEPLNLCVRDGTRSFQPQSSTLINFNNLSKNCSEIMNLKLPLLSSNLFSDFQLKPQTNDKGSSSKRSRAIEEGSKKFKSNSSDNNYLNRNVSIGLSSNSNLPLPKLGCGENTTTIRDLGLVNQLNFQLNLAKCAHLSSETSSHIQSREALGFVPLNNSSGQGLSSSGPPAHKGEGRKSNRRKGSSSIRNEGIGGESQIGHHHVPTTTGGSLFGQTDSGSNSGAQVSICKFKFTGGATPSLQEKKMLSVDSGGNFRFYTDKDKIGGPSSSVKSSKAQGISHSSSSISGGRDGESRPGEKDHHQQGVHYAYSALPKSAKSMSVCMPVVRPSSLKLPNTPSSSPNSGVGESAIGGSIGNKMPSITDAQQGTSSSSLKIQQGVVPPTTSAQELNNLDSHGRFSFPVSSTSSPQYPGEDGYSSSQSSESGEPSHSHTNHCTSLSFGGGPSTSSGGHFDAEAFKTRKLLRLKRKRRTRKSLMREKLEKTFKEKGFLIQTQQLESAEGATYCKFRQLRKFTRYLFRSWKDYLPDNVKEINNGSATSGGVVLTQNSSEGEGLQGEWRMSNNQATTVSGVGNDDNCEEDVDDEEDDEDETNMRMMELVPEVTLITQPSTPATIVDDEDNMTGSEEEVADGSEDDVDDDDDDVDVEQIDDKGGDFTSDNHNSP